MKTIHLIAALLFGLLDVSDSRAESPIRPGDRVAIIGNTFADQLRMHGYLETLLLRHTRGNPVSIRNLGWGGDMLTARDRPTGFPTEESTLRAHRTDVIVACFGMGESFAGEQRLDEFREQLKALIASHAGKKYNGTSEVRLVLVSPIACEDLGKLTPSRDERNRQLDAYTKMMRQVASAASISFVDLFETSRYLMEEKLGPQLTSNGIQLNAYGYWAMSQAFMDQLVDSRQTLHEPSWRLRIDVATKSTDALGLAIENLQTDDSGLRFDVTEEAWPGLRPPTDQRLPPQLQFARDTLAVSNLRPGKYRLTIDGTPIVSADAKAWREGVVIDNSPAHQAVEAYRSRVNDKNLQFSYSWKALNQVHIVGERKSSPSGRALPQEVIQFNKLAKERDAALRAGIQLSTRGWKLSRVGTW